MIPRDWYGISDMYYSVINLYLFLRLDNLYININTYIIYNKNEFHSSYVLIYTLVITKISKIIFLTNHIFS